MFGGESLSSYARRLATRNYVSVAEIDRWLRSTGVVGSGSARDPARVEAYRQLGGLDRSAFTTPSEIDGNWVSDRRLCLACTRGEAAWGRLPRAGMICLRHRRWLGDPGRHINGWWPQLAAERYFRRRLAARSVLVDSYAMRAGLEYAELTADTADLTGPRDDRQLRLYPRQIAYAAVLCDPAFLDVVADPAVGDDRRREVVSAAARTGGVPYPDGCWRVENRLWTLSVRLRRVVAATVPVVDSEYNLLRLSTLTAAG